MMTFETYESIVRNKFNVLTAALIAANQTITCMESCTSGLICSFLTDTEGASAVVPGGFVSYSNSAKIMFGVASEVIDTYGVYSSQTAMAMAQSAQHAFQTDYALGITGSFGNVDPANKDSIPGEVHICAVYGTESVSKKLILPLGLSRPYYKLMAADAAAELLSDLINHKKQPNHFRRTQ